MKILIFGVSGQDGQYLSAIYKARGVEVIGVARNSNQWMKGDVASLDFVSDIIKCHQPEIIFHLAANSTTRHDAIFEHHRTIGEGTLNILESVRQFAPSSKVFITGSGLQFKNLGEPIAESDPFDDINSYGVVRNYSVHAARYYRSLGISTYVGYLFHHESPLRSFTHISQIIVQAVKRIEAGSNEIIELGDISVRKEWVYAKDIAEGIITLINQDYVYEAVIGSGVAYSIEDWLQICFEIIGKDWRKHVKISGNFKAEYPTLVSNPRTINRLGWSPQVSLEQLARIMIESDASH